MFTKRRNTFFCKVQFTVLIFNILCQNIANTNSDDNSTDDNIFLYSPQSVFLITRKIRIVH